MSLSGSEQERICQTLCELIVHIRHSSGMLKTCLEGIESERAAADTLIEDELAQTTLHSHSCNLLLANVSRKGLFKLFYMVPCGMLS